MEIAICRVGSPWSLLLMTGPHSMPTMERVISSLMPIYWPSHRFLAAETQDPIVEYWLQKDIAGQNEEARDNSLWFSGGMLGSAPDSELLKESNWSFEDDSTPVRDQRSSSSSPRIITDREIRWWTIQYKSRFRFSSSPFPTAKCCLPLTMHPVTVLL